MNIPVFEKISLTKLCIVAVLLISGIALLHTQKEATRKPHAAMMLDAARRYHSSMEVLKDYCTNNGIAIDRLSDPNQTGYIGHEMTDITTTLGSLESKRTATNPDFAALIVDILVTIGVRKGDGVAFAFSGSFPSLNIASIIACEVLEAQPCIISSLGASMYGANRQEFTYLDIERLLFDAGVIHTRSTAVSLGGEKDMGSGMPDKALAGLQDTIRKSGIRFLYEPDLLANIEERMNIYASSGRKIKAMVNSGGTITSLGGCIHAISIPPGIILPSYLPTLHCRHRKRGIVTRMLEHGIPVLHLLNIRALAHRNDLPIDPIPLPEPGNGELYDTVRYPKGLASVLLVLTAVLLVGFRTAEKRIRNQYSHL